MRGGAAILLPPLSLGVSPTVLALLESISLEFPVPGPLLFPRAIFYPALSQIIPSCLLRYPSLMLSREVRAVSF